jgi:hypothetical protein
MQVLQTVREVFTVLGGTTGIAALTNASYRRAHNWKAFGRFPPKTYVILQKALSDRDLVAPASLWDMHGSQEPAE